MSHGCPKKKNRPLLLYLHLFFISYHENETHRHTLPGVISGWLITNLCTDTSIKQSWDAAKLLLHPGPNNLSLISVCQRCPRRPELRVLPGNIWSGMFSASVPSAGFLRELCIRLTRLNGSSRVKQYYGVHPQTVSVDSLWMHHDFEPTLPQTIDINRSSFRVLCCAVRIVLTKVKIVMALISCLWVSNIDIKCIKCRWNVFETGAPWNVFHLNSLLLAHECTDAVSCSRSQESNLFYIWKVELIISCFGLDVCGTHPPQLVIMKEFGWEVGGWILESWFCFVSIFILTVFRVLTSFKMRNDGNEATTT